MADRKISDLTALTTPASGDYLPIVDISEAAAASKNKRITVEELMRGMPDGTAAAPGIAFESDPNTGIYSPGADQVAISTNGTQRLSIDSTGITRIGSGSSGIYLSPLTGTAAYVVTDTTSTAAQLILGTSTNISVRFHINDIERMRLDTSGRLGLGTTSPSSLLHLADAGNITVGTTTGTKIGTATTQKIGFYNATPVVQPTAVADATDAATVITQLNALLAKLRTLGIIAT